MDASSRRSIATSASSSERASWCSLAGGKFCNAMQYNAIKTTGYDTKMYLLGTT